MRDARHAKFPMELADRMLGCVKFHITSQGGFIDGEEARLANMIPILLDKGHAPIVLRDWLKSLLSRATAKPYTNEAYQFVHIVFNIKNFLFAWLCPNNIAT